MLQDESANVVALVDPAGQVLRQDVYHPYGELAATDFFDLTHAPNSAGWKGLFFDKFTTMAADSPLTPGIYQNRNRSYSPSLGRFLQRDPNATTVNSMRKPSVVQGERRDGVQLNKAQPVSPKGRKGVPASLARS